MPIQVWHRHQVLEEHPDDHQHTTDPATGELHISRRGEDGTLEHVKTYPHGTWHVAGPEGGGETGRPDLSTYRCSDADCTSCRPSSGSV